MKIDRNTKRLSASTLLVFALALLGNPKIGADIAFAQQEEKPKEILASQIRKQGFRCDKPVRAERNLKASKPNETVWLLQCETVKYEVKLVPDMAAEVKKIN